MTALQSRRKTLEELLASGNTQELPDIAEINLLCAAEIPGSQSLDIDAALGRIDEMAQRVGLMKGWVEVRWWGIGSATKNASSADSPPFASSTTASCPAPE